MEVVDETRNLGPEWLQEKPSKITSSRLNINEK